MYNSDSWYFTHLCYVGKMHCSSHCHFCSHFIKNTNMMFLTLKFSPFCCYFIFAMHKYTYLPYTIGWRYTACVKMSILSMGFLNFCMTSDGRKHALTDRSGNNIRSISFITKYDMLEKNEQFFRKSGRRNLQTRPQVAGGREGLQI